MARCIERKNRRDGNFEFEQLVLIELIQKSSKLVLWCKLQGDKRAKFNSVRKLEHLLLKAAAGDTRCL